MVRGKKSEVADATRFTTNVGSYVFGTIAPALVARWPPAAAGSLSGVVTFLPATPFVTMASDIASAQGPVVIVSESMGTLLALAATLPVAFTIRGAAAHPPIVPLAGMPEVAASTLVTLLAPTSSTAPSPSPLSPYANAVFLVLAPAALTEYCADLDAAINDILGGGRGVAGVAPTVVAIPTLQLISAPESAMDTEGTVAMGPEAEILNARATANALAAGTYDAEGAQPLSAHDTAATVHIARPATTTPAAAALLSPAVVAPIDAAVRGLEVHRAGPLIAAIAAAAPSAIAAAIVGDIVPLPSPAAALNGTAAPAADASTAAAGKRKKADAVLVMQPTAAPAKKAAAEAPTQPLPRSVDSLPEATRAAVKSATAALPVLLPGVKNALIADLQGAVIAGIAFRAAVAAGAAAAGALGQAAASRPLADEVAAAVGEAAGYAVAGAAGAFDAAILRVCVGAAGGGAGGAALALERLSDWSSRVSPTIDSDADEATVVAASKQALHAAGAAVVATAWRVRAPKALSTPILVAPQVLLSTLDASIQHLGNSGGSAPRVATGQSGVDPAFVVAQRDTTAALRRFVAAANLALAEFTVVLRPSEASAAYGAREDVGVATESVWCAARADALPHCDLLTSVATMALIAVLPSPIADAYALARGVAARGRGTLYVPTAALTEDPQVRGFATLDRYAAAACVCPAALAAVSFPASAIGSAKFSADDTAAIVLRAAVEVVVQSPYRSIANGAIDSLSVLIAAAIDGYARGELAAGRAAHPPPRVSYDLAHPNPGLLSAAPLASMTHRSLRADGQVHLSTLPRAWQAGGRRPATLRDVAGALCWTPTLGAVGRSLEPLLPASTAAAWVRAHGASPFGRAIADVLRGMLKGRFTLSHPPAAPADTLVARRGAAAGGETDAPAGALLEIVGSDRSATSDDASRTIGLPLARPISEQVAAADQLALSLVLSVMPDGTHPASVADIGARLGGWTRFVHTVLPRGGEIGRVGGPDSTGVGEKLKRTLPDQLGAFVLMHPEALTLLPGGLTMRRVDPRGRRTTQMLQPERLAGLLPQMGGVEDDDSDDDGIVGARGGREDNKLRGWGADMFDGIMATSKLKKRDRGEDSDDDSSAGSDISARRRRSEALNALKDKNGKRRRPTSDAFLPVSRTARDGMEAGGLNRIDRASGRKLRNLKWKTVGKQRKRAQRRVVQGFIERRGAAPGNADR